MLQIIMTIVSQFTKPKVFLVSPKILWYHKFFMYATKVVFRHSVKNKSVGTQGKNLANIGGVLTLFRQLTNFSN